MISLLKTRLLFINVPTMTNVDHSHNQGCILNAVNHPIVTRPQAVLILPSLKLFAA